MAGEIASQTFSLKILFEQSIYRIDYYQREYAWSEDDVRTLIDDLLVEFRSAWQDGHYGKKRVRRDPYFLGPFVYSEENGVRFLVDGQQRFTTIHLIFIHLRRMAHDLKITDAVDKLARVILEWNHQQKTYRVAVEERKPLLSALYDNRPYEVPANASLSLRNLWARSNQIEQHLDSALAADVCKNFVDWLLSHVVLVGIRAPSRDSGFRIFESMNDRGARLTSVDLVKSFLLSNVGSGEEDLNTAWRQMLAEITTIRDDNDAPKRFLRSVLIGRYATVDPTSTDPEEIDLALNTWVRRNSQSRLGLQQPDHYLEFVRELIELSKHYVTFLKATRKIYHDDGLAALFYNDANGLTNQLNLVMAAVRAHDTPTEAKRKAALVANYLDRLFVIRSINEEPTGARDFEPDIRHLIPALRLCGNADNVAKALAAEISNETYDAVKTYGLRANNKPQIRYLLARLTAHAEKGCGRIDQGAEYLRDDRAWQIEHLWPNHYDWYQTEAADLLTFRLLRSRLGGLALLHGRDNASLNDMPVADKLPRYARQNNLLAVLSPGHRKNNTFARDFAKANDVEGHFREFGAKPSLLPTVEGRAELFRRLCLQIWKPQALGFPVEQAPTLVADSDVPTNAQAQTDGIQAKPRRPLTTALAKLVRQGEIAPGSQLVLVHDNLDHFATVDADGLLRFPTGDTFTKLDDAGRMITQKKCDGLGSWCVVTSGGTRTSIRELRDRSTAV